jgi:hypothetical protein
VIWCGVVTWAGQAILGSKIVPHILRPDSGKTLEESFAGKGYPNDKGNTECVEFIKQTLTAPPTKLWREGDKVTQGNRSILAGTAIATFVKGEYPQIGSSGKHAAVYLDQDGSGIIVLDQWRTQGSVRKRTIRWNPTDPPNLSNNGKAFSVIEW